MVFDSGFDFKSGGAVSDFEKAHNQSDTDFDPHALHHTLGRGPTQAARGNHNHNGEYALVDHTHVAQEVGQVFMWLGVTEPSGCLFLNGQGITRDNYPALFDVMEIPVGTDFTYLPDYRNAFLKGAANPADVGSLNVRTDTKQVDLSNPNVLVKAPADSNGDGTSVQVVTNVNPFDVPEPTNVTINFCVKAA